MCTWKHDFSNAAKYFFLLESLTVTDKSEHIDHKYVYFLNIDI